MQYQQFGNSGMHVSRYAIGSMMFGKKLSLDESRQVIDEAIDAGVNFIDTAESYGDSEAILGQILDAEKRDKVFLATKVFKKRAAGGHTGRNARTNIIHSLERSLSLLQTDHVDLYQLHHPDMETPIEETLAALEQMVKQGKVRHIGVSNHWAWQMAFMLGEARRLAYDPIVSVQCHYNLFNRRVEEGVLPFCRRFNIATMIYGPLQGGILSGKYGRDDKEPDKGRAASNKKLQKLLAEESTHDMLDQLRDVAKKQGLKLNQLAWLWLLGRPGVTTLLIGGSKPEHYRDAWEVADKELPPELVEQLAELTESRVLVPYENQPAEAGSPLGVT